VARLYADGTFRKKIDAMFEGDYKVIYHLAPPLLARHDPRTGEPGKSQFGSWMLPLFGILAKLKGLRGTAFDIFGRTDERRMERALIAEYESMAETLLRGLTRDNHALAIEIASIPESIRGYGHIKTKSVAAARTRSEELMARYRSAPQLFSVETLLVLRAAGERARQARTSGHDVAALLMSGYVDCSLRLPDAFILRFRDPGRIVGDRQRHHHHRHAQFHPGDADDGLDQRRVQPAVYRLRPVHGRS